MTGQTGTPTQSPRRLLLASGALLIFVVELGWVHPPGRQRMGKQPNGVERRRFLRRRIAPIPVAFESGPLSGRGHLKNISREGVFIRCEVLPEPGAVIQLLFHDRQGTKVEVNGVVRWTTAQLPALSSAQPGFGVFIEDPSEAFLAFYEQILTE